jgi:hypothetical protein
VGLTPRQPPGRLSRKALAFESEIFRLRTEGHSCEAIRQALFDAGLSVSRSTVKREVARLARRQHVAEARDPIARHLSEPPRTVVAFANDPRSSKEIAESFVKGRITNPLLRRRSNHEGDH